MRVGESSGVKDSVLVAKPRAASGAYKARGESMADKKGTEMIEVGGRAKKLEQDAPILLSFHDYPPVSLSLHSSLHLPIRHHPSLYSLHSHTHPSLHLSIPPSNHLPIIPPSHPPSTYPFIPSLTHPSLHPFLPPSCPHTPISLTRCLMDLWAESVQWQEWSGAEALPGSSVVSLASGGKVAGTRRGGLEAV